MNTNFLGDFPITDPSQDLFNVSRYAETLADFILQANTPLTISIQGEWGSGKTSLMNLLTNVLKSHSDRHFEFIQMEAWEYFIGNTENSVERFSLDLLKEIVSTSDESKLSKELQRLRRQSNYFISKGVSIIGELAHLDSNTIEDMKSLAGYSEKISIAKSLRQSICDLIEKNNALQGIEKEYIFLIDDLDRIEPKAAVAILEVLKNIFYIPKCVFVLSVDFEIVIKGLKSRYSEYIDEHPFNYKDYFDKLIQLSFSLPTYSYDVEPLFERILTEYGYWGDNELFIQDKQKISEILQLSVGSNPRKIKRLANAVYVSFLLDYKSQKFLSNTKLKIINILLLCIQQSYPAIYEILYVFPDYHKWNRSNMASYTSSLTNYSLQEDNTISVQYPWEETLVSICLGHPALQKFVHALKRLFELLDSCIVSNHYNIIKQIVSLSQITCVTSEIRYNGFDYQNNSFTQFRQGHKLIDMIKPLENAQILDIGCGNGLTTIELFRKFGQSAQIQAFDISPSQIDIAIKNRESHSISEKAINFYVMDVSMLSEKECFDLVFSNSALHWASDPKKVYSKIFDSLKPDGRVAIHQGGKGTYRGLHQIAKIAYYNLGLEGYFTNWEFPAYYPSSEEIRKLLESIGFRNIQVENIESTGEEFSTLASDFAKASLIYYYECIPKEFHQKLESEFLKQCQIGNVDYYTNRLYIFAQK